MYNYYDTYQCPFLNNGQRCNSNPTNSIYNGYVPNSCPYCNATPIYNQDFSNEFIPFNNGIGYGFRADIMQPTDNNNLPPLKDYGPQPFVININEATKENDNFRTALWTGCHLQLTLMSINVGEDIGLEIHPNVDQFLRIEEGQGIVKMGSRKDNLTFQKEVSDDFAIFIPAGTWHNVINTGNTPLKLYSIYAPPNHPRGTVHTTKQMAEAAEKNHHG